jgi:hypothetical protein
MITISEISTKRSSANRRAAWLTLTLLLCLIGCDGLNDHRDDIGPRLFTLASPLMAYCEAEVEGVGLIDVETDYLAHVVNCENGAADFEALKAQAVAARSYLYYKLTNEGSIGDGQSDQVYTCGRMPGPQHFEAVSQTSGQVLTYQNIQVATFYVAGAIPSTLDCIPTAEDPDPTNTERYVTYNEGQSGDDLVQSPLGWVNSGNLANRGCHSQNGAHCLSENGWNYEEILRFYYGEDIVLEQAIGECVSLSPDPEPNEGGEEMLDPLGGEAEMSGGIAVSDPEDMDLESLAGEPSELDLGHPEGEAGGGEAGSMNSHLEGTPEGGGAVGLSEIFEEAEGASDDRDVDNNQREELEGVAAGCAIGDAKSTTPLLTLTLILASLTFRRRTSRITVDRLNRVN